MLADALQKVYETKHQKVVEIETRYKETGLINNTNLDRARRDATLAGSVAAKARDMLAQLEAGKAP